MNRKEIKAKAKEIAFKNKFNVFKYYFITMAISFCLSIILSILGINSEDSIGSLLTLAAEIALIPLTVGYYKYILSIVRGENLNFKDVLFSKYNMFGTIFLTVFMVGICTLGWTLLFIIPGIIYSYKVAMIQYILADSNSGEVTWSDVIAKSKEMMAGHKMEFFVFELSFIGWILLSLVTLGIALIWTLPYVEIATAMYYDELKKLNTKPVTE